MSEISFQRWDWIGLLGLQTVLMFEVIEDEHWALKLGTGCFPPFSFFRCYEEEMFARSYRSSHREGSRRLASYSILYLACPKPNLAVRA